ncbi:MAG: hypothetical protein GQ574_21570 [Crocinitomix sp.]|nr:hypothetical protein [Crocinitomix sp.]
MYILLKHIKTPVLILILFFSTSAHRQKKDDQNNNFSITTYTGWGVADPNVKIGLLFQRGDAKLAGLPMAIGLKGELSINERYGIKCDLNYLHTGVSYNNTVPSTFYEVERQVYHRRTSTKLRILLGINIYFVNTAVKKTYFSLSLGGKYVNRNYTVDGNQAAVFYAYPFLLGTNQEKFARPALRIALGVKRNLSKKLFFSFEVGIGSNPLQLGLGIRL